MPSRRAVSLEVITPPWKEIPLDSVAAVLERATDEGIAEWYRWVSNLETIRVVPLSFEQRTAHLPHVFRALTHRLRGEKTLGFRAGTSSSLRAAEHGAARRQQGYTAAMMVEESRVLQVCLFLTLERHRGAIEPEVLLPAVMLIADEVDSQLREAMESYIAELAADGLPA